MLFKRPASCCCQEGCSLWEASVCQNTPVFRICRKTCAPHEFIIEQLALIAGLEAAGSCGGTVNLEYQNLDHVREAVWIGRSIMVGQLKDRLFLLLRIGADANCSGEDDTFVFQMTAANVLWNLRCLSIEAVARIRIPANQIQLLADFAGVHVEPSVPVGVVDGDGIGRFLVKQTQHAGFMARKDILDLFTGGQTVNRTVFAPWNGRLAGGSAPFHIAFRPFPFARNRQAFKAAKILTVIGKQKTHPSRRTFRPQSLSLRRPWG